MGAARGRQPGGVAAPSPAGGGPWPAAAGRLSPAGRRRRRRPDAAGGGGGRLLAGGAGPAATPGPGGGAVLPGGLAERRDRWRAGLQRRHRARPPAQGTPDVGQAAWCRAGTGRPLMNLDSRGRQVGQVTRQLAEARGPVPPFALVRHGHQRRAWRRAAVVAAAAITVAAVVTVQVGQQAGQDVTSRPRPPGQVAAVIQVGGQPNVVRADTDAVWVQRDREVVRVDPRTNRVVARLPMGPSGSDLGAVGGGSLWLTQVAQGTVTRIDPATGRTVATIRVPGAQAPLGIDM